MSAVYQHKYDNNINHWNNKPMFVSLLENNSDNRL